MNVTSQDALSAVTRDLDSSGMEAISWDAACRFLRADDSVLPSLLTAAQRVRARFHPTIFTYSRKLFLPLTDLCCDYCKYCTFRRHPGQAGAHTMTADEVMEIVHAGERVGCAGALFSLGDKPELLFPEMRDTLRQLGYKSTLHYLEAMCEMVLRESSLLAGADARQWP
jgi:2-iminoacetate synthase ThiH